MFAPNKVVIVTREQLKEVLGQKFYALWIYGGVQNEWKDKKLATFVNDKNVLTVFSAPSRLLHLLCRELYKDEAI